MQYRISYENVTPTSTSFPSAGGKVTPKRLGACTKKPTANALPAAGADCAMVQAAGGTGAMSLGGSCPLPGGTSGGGELSGADGLMPAEKRKNAVNLFNLKN